MENIKIFSEESGSKVFYQNNPYIKIQRLKKRKSRNSTMRWHKSKRNKDNYLYTSYDYKLFEEPRHPNIKSI